MYDWHPQRRGELLMPEGSKPSIQQAVTVTSGSDVLEKLYREGRLKGKALEDAIQCYGESE